MKKQLALYEELLDDDDAIIEQNPIVIVEGTELGDLRFALAPAVDIEAFDADEADDLV